MDGDEIIARYPYGVSLRALLWPMLFFGVCTVVLVFRALDLGGVAAWGMAAVSAAFVVLPLLMTAVSQMRRREIVVSSESISIPSFRGAATTIRVASIDHVELVDMHGQRFLSILHDGETTYINANSLMSKDDFRELVDFVATGELSPGAPTELPPPPPLAVPWHVLALKITAMLTFCGGPLYFSDLLQPRLGDPYGFLVAFSPVAVLVFATLSALEDEPTPFVRVLLTLGGLAAAVVVCMSAYATAQILGGEVRDDSGLILFGGVVSVVVAILYVHITRPVLASSGR